MDYLKNNVLTRFSDEKSFWNPPKSLTYETFKEYLSDETISSLVKDKQLIINNVELWLNSEEAINPLKKTIDDVIWEIGNKVQQIWQKHLIIADKNKWDKVSRENENTGFVSEWSIGKYTEPLFIFVSYDKRINREDDFDNGDL